MCEGLLRNWIAGSLVISRQLSWAVAMTERENCHLPSARENTVSAMETVAGYFSVIWFKKVGRKTDLGFVSVFGPSSEPKLWSGCPLWLVDVFLGVTNCSILSEFRNEMFYCERRNLWCNGLQFVIRCCCQHAFHGKMMCYVTASILRAEWRIVTGVIIALYYIQTAREVLNTGNNLQ